MEARDRKDLDPEQRLALLARALEADSTFAEAYVQSAVLSWRTDAFSRADSLLRAAARFRDDLPQYDALLLQWVEAWYRGDRDGAVSASRQLTLLDSRDDRVCRDATLTNQVAIAMPACMGSLGDPEYASAAGAFEFAWKDIGDMLHLAGDHEQELLRAREARALFPNRREAVLREIWALSALRRVDAIPALLDTLRARQNEGEVGARDWSLVWGLTVSAELLAAYGHNDLSGATAAEAVAWFDERDVRSMRHARALYVQGDFERARDIFAERVLLDAEDAAALGFAGRKPLDSQGLQQPGSATRHGPRRSIACWRLWGNSRLLSVRLRGTGQRSLQSPETWRRPCVFSVNRTRVARALLPIYEPTYGGPTCKGMRRSSGGWSLGTSESGLVG